MLGQHRRGWPNIKTTLDDSQVLTILVQAKIIFVLSFFLRNLKVEREFDQIIENILREDLSVADGGPTLSRHWVSLGK